VYNGHKTVVVVVVAVIYTSCAVLLPKLAIVQAIVVNLFSKSTAIVALTSATIDCQFVYIL